MLHVDMHEFRDIVRQTQPHNQLLPRVSYALLQFLAFFGVFSRNCYKGFPKFGIKLLISRFIFPDIRTIRPILTNTCHLSFVVVNRDVIPISKKWRCLKITHCVFTSRILKCAFKHTNCVANLLLFFGR